MYMDFRRATNADVDTLVALRKVQLVDEGLTPTNIDAELTQFFTEQLQADAFVQYIGEVNGQAVASGGIQFLTFPPSYTNASGKRGYIMNIYTHADYRGQGVARRVLDLLIAEASERGVAKLFLYASPMGKPVYKKYGFIEQEAWMEYTIT